MSWWRHRTLREVLRFVDSPCGVIRHRETHRTQGVLDTHDSPVFVHNSSLMKAFYEEVVRVGGDSTRGKPTTEKPELRKEFQRKLKSIQTHSDWFRALKEGIRDAEPAMADLVSSQGGTTFVKDVFYKYKNCGTGRRHACSHGAQNSPQAVRRETLLHGVEHWDMKNAMASLVSQVLPLCGVPDDLPCSTFTALLRYANNTSTERQWATRILGEAAKGVILAVIHGKAPLHVEDVELSEWLKDDTGHASVMFKTDLFEIVGGFIFQISPLAFWWAFLNCVSGPCFLVCCECFSYQPRNFHVRHAFFVGSLPPMSLMSTSPRYKPTNRGLKIQHSRFGGRLLRTAFWRTWRRMHQRQQRLARKVWA